MISEMSESLSFTRGATARSQPPDLEASADPGHAATVDEPC